MINYALFVIFIAFGGAIWPFFSLKTPVIQRIGSNLLLLVAGVFAVILGGYVVITGQSQAIQIPFGLPWLHWHLALDRLSAFFFIIVGVVSSTVAIYSIGYCQEYDSKGNQLTTLLFYTAIYIASMELVLLAADAFSFMVAWEVMSLSSYFLVASNHEKSETRKSAFLYLLMAQLSGLAILLSFGVMSGFGGDFSFAVLRENEMTSFWASTTFGLAFLGFGIKAGLFPMHAWLPDAHPVAPSHVSALLSAIIVKIALYGFIRVVFDLLGEPLWQWGVVVLLVGSVTALYGVIHALMQSNLKRLLAYSTVENVGIMFIGLGLSILFMANEQPQLAALAFIAALYHALNHACFKGLLFMGAGSILYKLHTVEFNKLGGLIHRMPKSALLFLFGSISLASLPPFNGFVSEWLTFQAALQVTALDSGAMRAFVAISAAILALTAALAATSLVKAFGLAFLGRARTEKTAKATEVPQTMLWGQSGLALLCLLLGVFPTWIVEQLNHISKGILGSELSNLSDKGWLWLTPVAAEKASYSAPIVFIGIAFFVLVWLGIYLYLKAKRRKKPVPRVPIWSCGFGPLNERMQYTAESFSMPVQRLFAPILDIEEVLTENEQQKNTPNTMRYARYTLQVNDLVLKWLYRPVAKFILAISNKIGMIQTGHLKHYLAYTLGTLVFLLWLI